MTSVLKAHIYLFDITDSVDEDNEQDWEWEEYEEGKLWKLGSPSLAKQGQLTLQCLNNFVTQAKSQSFKPLWLIICINYLFIYLLLVYIDIHSLQTYKQTNKQ